MHPWYIFGLEDAENDEGGLFILTIGALLLLAIVGLRSPQYLNDIMNAVFTWVLQYFGWWFMLLGFGLLVFSGFIVFSKYGKIRIGGQDAEPEFGLFS